MTAPILVTGATGNVGGALVRSLRDAGQPVRALLRSSSASPPEGVETVLGDLEDAESVERAARGVQQAFLLGGRGNGPEILAALRRAGVEHVVLLTSRSVIGGVPGNAIADMWLSAERALLESGVAWTLLRPSGFMSNVLRWREQLRRGDTVRVPFAEVPIAAIDPEDIAAVAAEVLTRSPHCSEALELSGPEPLLPEQQLAAIGARLGRALRIESLTGEAARGELASSFPPPFVDAFVRFFERGEFDDSRVVPTVSECLGRAPRRFEQWLEAHADELRS